MKSDYLVWLDLEMTGLDTSKDVIIEIGSAITDWELNVIAEGPQIVIGQPEALLSGMDEWNQKAHSSSGLLEEVRSSTVSVTVAEKETLNFISKYVKKGESPLCGNSIHTDRTYLSKEMPDLQEYLHYRIIDVSSLKGIVQRWYPKEYWFVEKEKRHRVMDDVRESISELRWYKGKIFPKIPIEEQTDPNE